MKLRRMQVLADMANRHGWTRLAELGVFRGDTAAHLLKNCPNLHWIGVDTWEPGDPSRDVPKEFKKTRADSGYRSYAEHPLTSYEANVAKLAEKYAARALVMKLPTIEAAKRVEGASLCAVFIDADHTPAGVEADIRAWAPKIRPGGMLMGHDYDLPVLREVLDRLLPGWHGYDDSVWGIPVDGVRL